MSVKFYIYIFSTLLVLWSMDSVQMNQIFKKNKVYQARAFYFCIVLALIYLVTNCIYDFFMSYQ